MAEGSNSGMFALKWYFTRKWGVLLSLPIFAFYVWGFGVSIFLGFAMFRPFQVLAGLHWWWFDWIGFGITWFLMFFPAACYGITLFALPLLWSARKYLSCIALMAGLAGLAGGVGGVRSSSMSYLADQRPCIALELGITGSFKPDCGSATNSQKQERPDE